MHYLIFAFNLYILPLRNVVLTDLMFTLFKSYYYPLLSLSNAIFKSVNVLFFAFYSSIIFFRLILLREIINELMTPFGLAILLSKYEVGIGIDWLSLILFHLVFVYIYISIYYVVAILDFPWISS